jgi:hypothetical protein
MKEQPTSELVEQLFAEIERAWIDRQDRTTVYKLADKHPEFRDELYEFFEDLVLGPGSEPSRDEREAEVKVADWLRSTGFGLARAAASEVQASGKTTATSTEVTRVPAPAGTSKSPERGLGESVATKDETWLAFLKRRTGQGISGLAQSLTDATTEYVAMVSRYPNLVPEGVKRELARQVEERWGIDCRESLGLLAVQPRLVKAAARSVPFEPEPRDFEELLERSALTASQKQAWLRYAV